MPRLERSEWYDFARDTNWTPRYVDEQEIFPPEMSDPYGIPVSEWETFDEPYKVSYREYVRIQREKDAGAYSVRTALAHSDYYEEADPAYLSALKMHYGSISLSEYAACHADERMVRFGRAPSMRNMATFGMLDEMRHGQIHLWFAHALAKKDRQFDWAHQAHHTQNWAVVAGRHALDDVMMTRDAPTTSLMLNFAFETGLTNVQMIGLSRDAANMDDYTFSNLITSIQSDEARHAQIGTPVIQIMIRNGKKAEAQQAVDIAFWRIWRVFAILVGISMDYQIPLAKRDRSFKEYMREFVMTQYERQLTDVGLDRPWYWDIFLDDIENHHHCQQGGIWSWRPTVWWNPSGAVGPAEREWLEEKYPAWNDTYGKYYWDTIIQNIVEGHPEKTLATGMPMLCNMCQIPISNRPGEPWKARAYQVDYQDRRYSFCTSVCEWIFKVDPERYKHHHSIVDRMYSGEIDPPTMENVLLYMGSGVVSEGGKDAYDYAWADPYRAARSAAE